MQPLVSVILPVYNQEFFLEETIMSILSQSFRNFELLIIDDGSTDSSAKIIQKLSVTDSRIIAYFEANVGKSQATNNLVNKAIGEWCAFLDADDVMMPERLEKQVAFHKNHSEIHASSSHCYYINQTGNLFATQRYEGLSSLKEFKQTVFREEFITCSYTGLMVSRKVFVEIGGLQKKLEVCEDFEFFNRLVDRGFILLVIPEVLMKYRIHPSAITVRKPLLVRDTISFVKHCFRLKRAGKPEISFEDFLKLQQQYSWWTKLNRRRFQYATIFFRDAGVSVLSKKYLLFLWQIAVSSALSPNYVFKKMKNHLKK